MNLQNAKLAYAALYADAAVYVECFFVNPRHLELLKTKRRVGIIVMVVTEIKEIAK